eukprot:SAG31_NODE_43336_length_267_cov_1.047619_1_plen_57_part_10
MRLVGITCRRQLGSDDGATAAYTFVAADSSCVPTGWPQAHDVAALPSLHCETRRCAC